MKVNILEIPCVADKFFREIAVRQIEIGYKASKFRLRGHKQLIVRVKTTGYHPGKKDKPHHQFLIVSVLTHIGQNKIKIYCHFKCRVSVFVSTSKHEKGKRTRSGQDAHLCGTAVCNRLQRIVCTLCPLDNYRHRRNEPRHSETTGVGEE